VQRPPGYFWLFLALALLYLAPLWSVRYLPTLDGPCHVYSAWAMREHGNQAEHPLIARYFEINWKPVPNWLGHGLLALAMFAAPPVVAEKLLLSAYVLLLLLAFWYLAGAAGPERRIYAFFGFPFVFNATLLLGFYNFCLSVALFMLVIGAWWRHWQRPDLRFAWRFGGLLLLCYFAHLLSFLMALGAIAVLWLVTLPGAPPRRHLRHLAIVAPLLPLPLWFLWSQRHQPVLPAVPTADAAHFLLGARAISLDAATVDAVAPPLCLLLAVLAAATLAGGRVVRSEGGGWRLALRREDGFLLLALAFAVLMIAGPDAMAGGAYIQPRMGLYPFLALVPWLNAGGGRLARGATVTALALLALLNLACVERLFLRTEPLLHSYLLGLGPVPPGARLLVLGFGPHGAPLQSPLLTHLAGYAGAEKGLMDWNSCEATTNQSPLQFRPQARRLALDFERGAAPPVTIHLADLDREADAVYGWNLPLDSDFAARLGEIYQPVLVRGSAALFLRRAPAPTGK
jgi:hypothetical protein